MTQARRVPGSRRRDTQGSRLRTLLMVLTLTLAVYSTKRLVAAWRQQGPATFSRRYTLTPLPVLGAEVRGIDLTQNVAEETVHAIREDVTRHRLLVFRGQGILPAERQLAITTWFGEVDTSFDNHPRAPHPDVARMSNDPTEGLIRVGSFWHIDGFFQKKPNTHSIYHMVEVPRKGATDFVGLHDLLQAMPAEKRARWERLWLVAPIGADPRPLVYPHPVTGIDTLVFHTQFGFDFEMIWDYGTAEERKMDKQESWALLSEIRSIVQDPCCNYLVYSHEWQPGDVLISDNLAVAHRGSQESGLGVDEVGLRVLHRTTTKGKYIMSKNGLPRPQEQQQHMHATVQ